MDANFLKVIRPIRPNPLMATLIFDDIRISLFMKFKISEKKNGKKD